MALDRIIANHGNITKSMREVGYREATIENPSNLTNSTGFKELCEEYGLTDNLLIKSLVEDIKKKKGNRKPELELGFKVRGRLQEDQEDKNSNHVININFNILKNDIKPRNQSREETGGGMEEVVRHDN